MNKTLSRRFFVLNVIFGCFCRGQIKLAPTDVPWENEQWTLQCSVNPIVSVVTIKYPDSSAAGNCEPANTFLPAKCTPSAGNIFVINETANTVSMTRTIVNSDTGTWTCVHSGDSTPYSLSTPLPNRTLPISSPIYEMHAMTAKAGSELTSDTEHSFYFHYGCVSTNLKFVWTTVPGSSWSDTSNTNSNSFACTTNLAYMSELATSAAILKSVSSEGTQLKVSVYVDGYDNLAVAEYTYNVTFAPGTGGGGGGSGGGGLIAGIIVAVIVIIATITIICCLCNKRCRSRCLLKNSKCLFTCPGKDIVVIDIHDDKDLTITRPTGEKIEIQCLRTEIGWYVFDDKVLYGGNGVKVMNNPCMLFNPFFEICCLEMEHEGLYTYKRENDSKNGCMLTIEICKDIIISSKPCVYWAHEGEWIKLQLVQNSVVVERWIKKNSENEKEIIIPNPQKKSSLVLQNINNKDAGSYIAENTSETWKSGCLTLKIVNSLVTVGKKDGSYVTIINNSIKLKFIGCKLANIKLLKWKQSLLTEGTEIREIESTSNYELILSKMTKNDEGRYWCEVINIDGTSTNSGILTLHVVHDIVNVGLSPVSCSAKIGNSIQIRYINEIIPQQIIFTAKRSGSNQIAPERKVTKITDTASLFIGEISKEDEGCYLFASADGDAISGVLTLSVIEGNERYNTLYLGQSESGRSAFQPRNGAKTFLDAIPKKEDIQETPDKKKKKKGKKTKKEKEKAEEVDETA